MTNRGASFSFVGFCVEKETGNSKRTGHPFRDFKCGFFIRCYRRNILISWVGFDATQTLSYLPYPNSRLPMYSDGSSMLNSSNLVRTCTFKILVLHSIGSSNIDRCLCYRKR